MAKRDSERLTCFYCGALISGSTEYDHFPYPRETGGTETVACCTTCHDMKDRFPLEKWPEDWLAKVLSDFPTLNRETRIFLAKAFRLHSVGAQKPPASSDAIDRPIAYEEKFKGLIQLCAEAESGTTVVVAAPEVLGDTYEEIIETLRRFAAKELLLAIADSREMNKESRS